MNGKQAKALRALVKTDVENNGWSNGYHDINIKEKVILDAWGKPIGTYTTSTKVLNRSARTVYKLLKEMFRKNKVSN